MELFQKIRDWMGIGVSKFEDEPIDVLDSSIIKSEFLENELNRIKSDFDAISNDLQAKIDACDTVLEKAVGEYNKKAIVDRLDRITTESFAEMKDLTDQLNLERENIENIESELLTKAIELTAFLSEEEQKEINTTLKVWEVTGLIKGEIVESQAKAITLAVDLVVKGEDAIEEEDELEKSHLPTDEYSHDTDDVEPDLTGHYANVIVKRTFKNHEGHVDKILFLKRAANKTVEPNKYCLPGGHIDKGENIIQAAKRELKEEANLHCTWISISAKAKCSDGKWAFYLSADCPYDVMLLDGENSNACWMTMEEWMEADLMFDLKEHLIAMEVPSTRGLREIPTINKAEDEDYDLEKGGEGSKGGHIIGHTKSGKPVYANKSANHNDYKNFGHHDHIDAADLHEKELRKHAKINNRHDEVHRHYIHGDSHLNAAGFDKANDDFDLEKGGVGSGIEGHTTAHLEKEYASKSLDELRALKKKLYSNIDLQSPISPEEKALTNAIAKKFSDINAQVRIRNIYGGGKPHIAARFLTRSYFPFAKGDDLEKGQFYGAKQSEGSRGGRVIGHTRSGKPVYARFSPHHYKGFTANDHQDAAKHHASARAAGEGHTFGTTGSSESFWHGKKQKEHEDAAGIKKGDVQENDLFTDTGTDEISEQLEKGGKRGTEGEVRTWKGRKFQKHGKIWMEIRDPKKKHLPVADIKAHAEATPTRIHKEIAAKKDHPMSPYSERTLEERKLEKEKNKPTPVIAPAKKKVKPKTVNIKKTKSLDQLVEKYPEVYGKAADGDFDKFFDDFYKTVASRNEAFQNFAQKLADDIGGELVMGPVKSKERAKEKVLKDFGGDVSKLNDLIRCTIIMKTPMRIKRGMNKLFNEHEEDVERYFADFKSEGYNGGNINMRMDDGVPSEIQFNTPINLALKDNIIDHPLINKERDVLKDGGILPGKGHDFYEKLQELDRSGQGESDKAKKITSWMQRYYGFRDYFQKALEENNFFGSFTYNEEEDNNL